MFRTCHHSRPVISSIFSNTCQRRDQTIFWNDLLNRILLSLLVSTISNPATDACCKYHRSKTTWSIMILSLMVSTGPKSLFNQSLLISTPRPYLIKNSAIIIFISRDYYWDLCSSFSTLSEIKAVCISLDKLFQKNSYLKIYSQSEDYKFLEPKLVNSFKVIRLGSKDFEILS